MNLNEASSSSSSSYILMTGVVAGPADEQAYNYYSNVINHHHQNHHHHHHHQNQNQNQNQNTAAGVYGYGYGYGGSGGGGMMSGLGSASSSSNSYSNSYSYSNSNSSSSSNSISSSSSISIDGDVGGGGGGSWSSSASAAGGSGGGGGNRSSRYESQKRRDWNTFGQYLQSIRPGPLPLAKCSGEHVLEFLRYLDRFGKTQIHQPHCPHFGLVPSQPIKSSSVSPACECPLRQAWGSLDALIGRLRAAFEENGGKPELNPFGAKIVRIYLRNVRDLQAKARGIAYQKKTRKRPRPSVDSPVTPTDNSPVTHSSVSTIEPTNIIHPQHLSNRYSH